MIPIVVNIAMTVVMAIGMSIGVVTSESTIGPMTIRVVVIAPVEVASMALEPVTSTILR
jgi:hypothetical protein